MDSAEQPHRCKCKVGSCPLCGSACKRCGCACDGVEPGVALARSSGQRGPKRLSTGSEQREAAKRARIEIAKATDLEERTIGTEPTVKQVETVHDLWQAFGWSQATKKKLPNEDLRKGDVLLKESGGSGWSTMVQSVLAAVESVAAADALEVIKDAAENLELYRGHRVRVTNQQVHLEKIIKDMEKKCLDNKRSSEALVVADWKMNFEAMSSRETSQQHFAKRGIGWHGCLCLYFKIGSEQLQQQKVLLQLLHGGGGIQNSFVQLITLDREKLQKLSAAIGKVVKEAKGYFARCNDTFYMECEGEWATQKLTGIEELTKAEIVFNIRCFAYSGIGDGVTFRTSLKTGLLRPCSCNASVNYLEADSKDDDDESTDIGGEELSVDANVVADYIFHVEGDDNEVEDQDEGEENDEDEIYSEDDDNEIAPAGFSGYGERPGNGQLIRQDMVAAAVRLASILITNHSVNITNGHSEMEEYNLAAHLEISEKNHNHKHQGRLVQGSPADQSGQLYQFDELISVNGQDVSRMDHSDEVTLIKASGTTITLEVQQPQDLELVKQQQLPRPPRSFIISSAATRAIVHSSQVNKISISVVSKIVG
eukprot:Em0001g3208a